MRFAVSYKLSKIDQSYRMKIYGLIKQAIRTADSHYYEKIFIQSNNSIKPFSFSTFLHNFTLEGSTISLNQITITISSPDIEFYIHSLNGFHHLKEYKLEDEIWIQSSMRILKEETLTTNKAVFETLSPILIEDKSGMPLSPEDPNYNRELNYYANLQVKQISGRNLYEPLQFTPLKMKKTVIKEKNRHMKMNTPLYFTTYRGRFLLEGNPKDLQFLYQLGVGKRTTYFGLLNFIAEG